MSIVDRIDRAADNLNDDWELGQVGSFMCALIRFYRFGKRAFFSRGTDMAVRFHKQICCMH